MLVHDCWRSQIILENLSFNNCLQFCCNTIRHLIWIIIMLRFSRWHIHTLINITHTCFQTRWILYQFLLCLRLRLELMRHIYNDDTSPESPSDTDEDDREQPRETLQKSDLVTRFNFTNLLPSRSVKEMFDVKMTKVLQLFYRWNLKKKL